MSVVTEAAPPTAKPKRTPEQVRRDRLQKIWRCQFCVEGHHASCPRAVRHGPDLWTCKCESGQHAGLHCTICKHDRDDEVNPQTWRCFDEHGCAVRHQQRRDDNPIWRMVHAAKVHSAVVRRQKRLMYQRTVVNIDPDQDETIERMEDMLAKLSEIRTKPSKPKPSKPKATSGKCECCGEPTKGGKFLPGHDAKLASVLRARVQHNNDTKAYEEMKRRGWLNKLPVKYRNGVAS